ncbi:MAG: thioredoxin domain-containing protein [Ruminococcus sp.]|nr:thioredoxin domain-containing protein [Ruminococcus sp.]
MIKYLENENLNDVIKEGLWLVDFYADWCGPCKMLGNVLEELDNNILKINVDTHEDLATTYGVMSIPTVCFFKDGNLKEKVIGFRNKEEIEEILKKME